MWILFSTVTVLLWGTSDVIFKSSSDDKSSMMKLIAFNGIILGLCSIAYMFIFRVGFSFGMIVRYLPIATVYIASMFMYYRALPLVKVSIASPIANSSCVLVTLLCVFFLQQQVSPLQAIAIICIVIAIIILSTEKDKDIIQNSRGAMRRDYVVGVSLALGYFLLDGIATFLDDYILDTTLSAEEVNVSYGLIYLVIGLICFVIVKVRQPGYHFFTDKRKIIGSFIETGGQFSYIYALSYGDAALASPFIATFSMVSIILSRIFLKEKLKAKQYILIALMLIGIALLSME